VKVWVIAVVSLFVVGGLALLVAARVTPGTKVTIPPSDPSPPLLTTGLDLPDAGPGGEYLGVIVAEQAVDIAANLEGRLADVLVRVGDHVARDAPVAVLDLRTLQSDLAVARAEVTAAKANENKSRLEVADADAKLARAAKLGAIISAADLDAARYEKQLAQTRLESARAGVLEATAKVAKLEVSRTDSSVRAPFAGVVAARYLDPGSQVHSQTPIVRLISAETLRVRFAIPEDDARILVPGKAVRAHLPALGLDLKGTIETVAPEVDPAARMIFAEARLEPPPPPTPRPPAGLVARVEAAP
jgi:RND family efflux transporter MFP subunit